MSRDFNGSSQHITAAGGDFASNNWTYGTFAAIVRFDTVIGWKEMYSGGVGSGDLFFGVNSSGVLTGTFSGSESFSDFSPVANTWYCIIISKGTGTVAPKYNVYNPATDSWNSSTGSAALPDHSATISTHYIGSYQGSFEHFDGHIRMMALYGGYVPASDAEAQSLGLHVDEWSWRDLAIRATRKSIWSFDQGATTTPVRDLSGLGANENGGSAPAIGTVSVPFFSYGAPIIVTTRQPPPSGTDVTPSTLQGTGSFGTPTISAVDGLRVKGTGALTASAGASASVTLPSNAADDLILLCFTGRPSGTAGTADTVSATGYTQHPATINRREIGTQDLNQVFLYKISNGSESNPTVNVGTAYQSTSTGWSCFAVVIGGADTANLLDTTTQVTTAAAAATASGPNITTAVDGSLVINFVGSGDDNALSMTTAQGFTAHASGSSYHTTTGGDHAAGLASKIQTTAGAVTVPTWTQTLVGNDAWVGMTLAIRAAVPGTTVTPGALQGTGTFPQSTISATGTATPSAINGVGTFGVPTPQVSTLVQPSTLTSVLAFPSATIQASGRAAPVVLPGVGTFPSSTLSATGKAEPSTLQGVGSFGVPTLLNVVTASPSTLNSVGSFPAVTPSATGNAAPTVLPGVGTFPHAAVQATGTALPAALAGSGTFPTPTPATGTTVAPGVLQGTGSFPQAAPRATGVAAPLTLGGVGSFGQALTPTTGKAEPVTLNSVGSFGQAVITTTGKAQPSTLNSVGSFGLSAIAASGVVLPTTISGVGTFGVPTISTTGAGTAAPQTLQGVGVFGSSTISATGRATPTVLQGVGSFPTPTVGSAISVAPSTLSGAGSFGTPAITIATVVAPPCIQGVGSFGASTVITSAIVIPSTLQSVGTFGLPLIDIDTGAHPFYSSGGLLSNKPGGRVLVGGQSSATLV